MAETRDDTLKAWSREQSLAERFAVAVTQLNRLKGVLIRVIGRVTLGGTASEMVILHRAAAVSLDQTLPLVGSPPRRGYQALQDRCRPARGYWHRG